MPKILDYTQIKNSIFTALTRNKSMSLADVKAALNIYGYKYSGQTIKKALSTLVKYERIQAKEIKTLKKVRTIYYLTEFNYADKTRTDYGYLEYHIKKILSQSKCSMTADKIYSCLIKQGETISMFSVKKALQQCAIKQVIIQIITVSRGRKAILYKTREDYNQFNILTEGYKLKRFFERFFNQKELKKFKKYDKFSDHITNTVSYFVQFKKLKCTSFTTTYQRIREQLL